MVYMLWKRSGSRPESSPPTFSPLLSVAVFILLIPFVWFLGEANPDWRLLAWLHATLVIAATLALILRTHGEKVVAHYAFPIAFFLLSIPWPSAMEQLITGKLMAAVAWLTVELLNLMGTPAIQRGNIIETASGLVGIDEACSGVRSLQATLMAAVFIGELMRLATARRVLLVGLGVLVTLLFNVVRTFLLTRTAAVDGLQALAQWHDPAGWSIFAASFVALVALAWLLGGSFHEPSIDHARRSSPPAPARWLVVAGGYLVLGFSATGIYYHAHERAPHISWSVQWPSGSQIIPIPDASREMLDFDEGSLRSVWDHEGNEILVAFLRWNPGPGSQQILSRLHRPETCLPAAGWILDADLGTVIVQLDSIQLPFRAFRFRTGNETWMVYQCFWENVRNPVTTAQGRSGRLMNAIQGRRNAGHQTLQLAFQHDGSEETARAVLENITGDIISMSPVTD